MSFWTSLTQEPFLQRALLIGVLASILVGFVGPLMLLRRASYLGASMTHAVLGGVGAALYFGFSPLIGAMTVAIAVAIWMSFLSEKGRQEEEALSGGLWSVGVAIGILFLAKTPGFQSDLMSYLFGNMLLISNQDLWGVGLLVLFVVGMITLFYKQLLALCFDEEHTRLQGIATRFFDALILVLVALSVVVLMRVVGIVLVMALLTLPSAAAMGFSFRFWAVCGLAILFGWLVSLCGLWMSHEMDLPPGASTVLLTALAFAICRTIQKRKLKHKSGY